MHINYNFYNFYCRTADIVNEKKNEMDSFGVANERESRSNYRFKNK